MLKIKVEMEQFWYAKQLVNTTNFGKRGDFDGNYDQQLVGMLAQTVVADYFKLPRPIATGKSDGGVDFYLEQCTIDLKTMSRTVDMEPHFVHNMYGAQAKTDTDILLFSSYNKKKDEITLCGWLPKKEFLKKAMHYPQGSIRKRGNGTSITVKGKAGNYEIVQSELNLFKNKTQFKRELKKYRGANKIAK